MVHPCLAVNDTWIAAYCTRGTRRDNDSGDSDAVGGINVHVMPHVCMSGCEPGLCAHVFNVNSCDMCGGDERARLDMCGVFG